MAIITDYLILDIIIVLVPLLYFLYLYLKSPLNYWEDRGVPFVKPVLFFGNLGDVLLGKRFIIDVHNDLYKQLEGKRFGGYYEFSSPALLIRDLALIERILIKDFSCFHDRGKTFFDENDSLTLNLVNLEGQVWRNLRYKLSPTFTSGKLKSMIEQICNCGHDLLNEIEKHSMSGEAVEAKYLINVFSLDVIASCAFGLQFKANTEDSLRFRQTFDKFFSPGKFQMFRIAFIIVNKKITKFLGLRLMEKSVRDYFMSISKATVKYREENKITRNDFLQLMLTLRDEEKSGKDINMATEITEEDDVINQMEYTAEDKKALKDVKLFTEDCIAAQSFVFLTAGSDTTSATLSFALYELASHPEVQSRLQQEVDSIVSKHKQWNFEAVKEMVYLDQVIQETMRMFTVGTVLSRKCSHPYKIPGTDIVLETGTTVNIPLAALHRDPRYYPQPDVFNPDRFEGNNHRPTIQPRPYLPFGDGPRVCIGMRFAILEMKICLARIMSEYSLTLSDKTQTPLQWEPSSLIPRAKGGIWVKFQKRSKT